MCLEQLLAVPLTVGRRRRSVSSVLQLWRFDADRLNERKDEDSRKEYVLEVHGATVWRES